MLTVFALRTLAVVVDSCFEHVLFHCSSFFRSVHRNLLINLERLVWVKFHFHFLEFLFKEILTALGNFFENWHLFSMINLFPFSIETAKKPHNKSPEGDLKWGF